MTNKLGVLLFSLGIVLALSAVHASAEEPTGFADIPWGTTYDATKQICGRPKFDLDEPNKHIFCEAKALSFASWRGPMLLFSDSALSGYLISAPSGNYQVLRSASVEKFGPPQERSVQEYTRRLGSPVTGEVLVWTWPSGTIARLSQLCSKIDTSCLSVLTQQHQESAAAKRREEVDKAKRQF